MAKVCVVKCASAEPVLRAFETLASDPDAEVRTLAASVLAKADAKRTAKLMPNYLTDHPTLARVQAVGGPVGDDVTAAVGKANEQSVALPVVIAKKDVATFKKHGVPVAGAAFLPSGIRTLSIGGDLGTLIWDVSKFLGGAAVPIPPVVPDKIPLIK